MLPQAFLLAPCSLEVPEGDDIHEVSILSWTVLSRTGGWCATRDGAPRTNHYDESADDYGRSERRQGEVARRAGGRRSEGRREVSRGGREGWRQGDGGRHQVGREDRGEGHEKGRQGGRQGNGRRGQDDGQGDEEG